MDHPATRQTAALLVECFVPASGESDAIGVTERLAAACADLDIAYLGTLVVPVDEVAFHVFGGSDIDMVLAAGHEAGLRIERVVPSHLLVAVQPDGSVAHATGEIGP